MTKLNLPKEITISIEQFYEYTDVDDYDELEESILDYLSNLYGFCINSFNFEIKGKKIYVSNIDWDTTD